MDIMIKDTLKDSLIKVRDANCKEIDPQTKAEIQEVIKSYKKSYRHLSSMSEISFYLACEILISEKFIGLDKDSFEIRLCCYNLLSNHIHDKYFIKEFREMKKRLKLLVFNPEFDNTELLQILHFFECSCDLKQMRRKHQKINRLFNPAKYKKISKVAYAVSNVFRYLEEVDCIVIKELNNTLDNFPNNIKYWVSLIQYLLNVNFKQQIQNESKTVLLKIIDEKITSELAKTSKIELICLKIDKNIKDYLLDADNVREALITINASSSEIVPIITKAIIGLSDDDQNYLKSLEENYKCSPVRSFADFDDLFASMLLSILDTYVIPNDYFYFYRLKSVRSLQFKLSAKYKVLKNLPKSVSSTIMEMMLSPSTNNHLHPNVLNSISNPRKSKSQIIKFFVKKVKPSISYMNLPESSAKRFFNLLQHPPFINIITQFYDQGALNEDLQEILKRITIMKFPRRLSGLFLRTHHISLKMFRNASEVHLEGAYFLVFLHELAHYLQRAGCSTVNDSNQPFSPHRNNNDPSTEGGFLLEERLFGKVSENIRQEQAEFLMNAEHLETVEEFQTKYKELGEIKMKSPILNFRQKDDALVLGSCAFKVVDN